MKPKPLSDGSQQVLWSGLVLALASYLPRRGLKRGSLSGSGALAAFLVGAIHMSCGLQYGMTLIVFYLSSSKLTRLGAKRKAALEEGHQDGGRRGAAQVLANSLAACIYAALSYASALAAPYSWPLLSRASLAGAFLGHYACCCGDTWASELGILSTAAPRLITTGRKVPPGTNGGVSPLGLCCSIAGGLTVGLAFFAGGVAGCALGPAPRGGSLCPEPPPAAESSGRWTTVLRDAALSDGPAGLSALTSVGLLCGLFGSLLDSLLGATLQYTGWDPQTGRVASAASAGGRHAGGAGAPASAAAARVQHVSGVPLLSNSGVNFVAAAATAALGAALLERW
ncbi:hypothetical protein PLESTB_001039300 [Pleodorina starrii]|uniref:Transmembrane protein 19 n=1 Tax=Pleodorina starrii TaxID=330485 RepID=A0A9W6BPI3_9CHLO|nr:hypothetical protein PLESTB_001039300 [Pleodorina starrii]GLC63867.1 hypothetical protein PLESTF_000092100 [Pleodorina starrii]